MNMLPMLDFLERGGAVVWMIAALSVATLAVALWKLWRFARMGLWASSADDLVAAWQRGEPPRTPPRDAIGGLAFAAIAARRQAGLTEPQAREETERVARAILADLRSGLRVLDLTVTIAPLLGLLGTVIGMIDAFQALQAEGAGADPATLAGGIWQALLTTAAGMAVAIPASIALTWFESVIDTAQMRMEDAATRIFTAPVPG